MFPSARCISTRWCATPKAEDVQDRGNVVDPLEVIEKHGTDAVRFTLAVMAAPGTDIVLSEERILSYRAFANKIWNAARFIFFNLEKLQAATGTKIEELAAPEIRALAPYPVRMPKTLADRWIFSRLARTVDTVNDALEHFRFHEAAHVVYHFFWGDFCDWYIEWVKPELSDSNLEPGARCLAEPFCRLRGGAAPAAPIHAVSHRGTLAPLAATCGKR